MWAREEYHAGRITARELAETFDLALDSVRRMLRGDTYRNVGMAIPREPIARTLDDGGALKRLLAYQEEVNARGPASPQPKPRSEADRLLEEMTAEGGKRATDTPLTSHVVDEEGETEASRAMRGNAFDEGE